MVGYTMAELLLLYKNLYNKYLVIFSLASAETRCYKLNIEVCLAIEFLHFSNAAQGSRVVHIYSKFDMMMRSA